MFACACLCVYVCMWVFAHVCMFMPLCLCACLCRQTCVHSRYMAGCTLGKRRLRVESQALSQVSQWPRCGLHPPLWLLRSLPLETRELSFGTKWASLPEEGGKLLPKANRTIIMLARLEPRTLFNSEGMCAGSRPAEQAPACPGAQEHRPAGVAFGTGSLLVRDKPFQGQTVTQICGARVGGGWGRLGGERGLWCLP